MSQLTLSNNITLNIAENYDEMSTSASSFLEQSIKSLNSKINLILPGGSTPRLFLNQVSQKSLEWSNIKVMLSDERLVPMDSPFSNTRMLKEELIDKIEGDGPGYFPLFQSSQLSSQPINSIDERLLAALNQDSKTISVLGFGSDGHTASLFPFNSDNLDENERAGFLVNRPNEAFKRLTLSFETILDSSLIIFLMSGLNKAKALYETVNNGYNPDKYPVQHILRNFSNPIQIFCDQEAAKMF